LQPLHCIDRLDPVTRLCDDLDLRIDLEQLAKARADQCLIVGDDDADAQRDTGSSGNRAFTMKPPPLFFPATRVPPCSSTRSRIPATP
jgi:hypothetical protein